MSTLGISVTVTDSGGHATSATTSCTIADSFVLGVTVPDISNTGLAVEALNLSDLTVVNGDLLINDAYVVANGSVLDRLWVMGHVVYSATVPVLLRNSLVQGRSFPIAGTPPYTSLVHARTTFTPQTARLSLENCRIYPVQPDVNLVCVSGERLGPIDRCEIYWGSDLINVWDSVPIVRGCYLHHPTFWANDPKHTNDGSHPGWSHNDAIQNNGSDGAQIIGNNIDMHMTSVAGDPSVLAAGGFSDLDWGACVMLTGSTGRVLNAVVQQNRFRGGQVHVAMPYQNSSNPYESGNTWEVHHNGHDLPHAYGTNQRQFVRWGWGKGPGVASVHDEYLLSEGNVPQALRGTTLPVANLAGTVTPASGQWIVRINA